MLCFPTLKFYIFALSLSKIRNDCGIPPFSRMVSNDTNLRRSSQCYTFCRPEQTQTAKRSKEFFVNFFMRFLDDGKVYWQ